MTLRLPSLTVLMAALVWPTMTAIPSAQRAGRPGVHFREVDQAFTFSDPSFGTLPNGAAHAQDILVSSGDWQYLAYWNAERYLTLARRELPGTAWERIVFADYQILGQDSHNAISIGISESDGVIHMAFDHHVDDLHYRRSLPGVATDPVAFAWTAALFGPVESVLDPAHGPVTKLTYPRFVPTPQGDLLFVYREFSSGDGRMRLVDYSSSLGTWSDDRVFIERTGSHFDPLGGSSTRRNPYLNRIAFDDQGTLHATWTWRERAPIRYNRDIAYAFSEDGGSTWRNAASQIVAQPGGLTIDTFTPGIRGVEIGAEYGLMNDQGHVVDGRGRVHTVMYRKIQPDTVVSYGNVFNSLYHHDWLDADGVWRTSQLTTIGNRPKLLADQRGNLILAYVDAHADLTLDRATPESGYLDWKTIFRLPGRFSSSVQMDHAQFARNGRVSIVLQEQPVTPGLSSSLGVVDLRPSLLPTRVLDDESIEPEADAYVRSGIHADTAFGSEDQLVVKEDAAVDYDRVAYLRFDLAALVGSGPIERVHLVTRTRFKGPLARTTPYFVHAVADDSWDEGMTWNDRPPLGAGLTAHFGRGEMSWDVTAAALEALAGDGRLSLALQSARQESQSALTLWSREAAESRRPRLVLHRGN